MLYSLNIFYCLCLREAKGVIQKKKWTIFYICLIWFGVAFRVTVLKVLYFWRTLCKVVGNQGFFSYCRCNLLRIATVLKNVCHYIFLTLCNTLYSKNTKYEIYIDVKADISIPMRLFKQVIKTKQRKTENVK